MFGNFLKGIQHSEWSHFMDYLSPLFFEVVPTLEIAKQTTQLGKTYAKLKHPEEEAQARSLIKALKLPVNFREPKASTEMLTSLSKQEKGRIALKLYFGQIMFRESAWLDLRSNTFEYLSKECNWNPPAWIKQWDPIFLESMRKIYLGYYGSDDKLYIEGLRELHLDHAADIFTKQFDTTKEGKMVFRLKDFRDSFHEIFLSCKQSRSTLHPNFFALGLLLSSLYENLESLGESYDVKKIFQETMKAGNK